MYSNGPLAYPPVPITKSGLNFLIILIALHRLNNNLIGKSKFFIVNFL